MSGRDVYSVKEIYLTLQGEGAQTGLPAIFCRFAGCNLWDGREESRASAVCRFCDTDFVGTDGINGGKYQSAELVEKLHSLWPAHTATPPTIVFTGGEPLLQLDSRLIADLKRAGLRIAVETNGTIAAPDGIDWICVSPKSSAPVVQTSGQELKLVYPQTDCPPEQFEALDFEHFFLQPMDGPDLEANIKATTAYCLAHPNWRLSLQTHKFIGID